MAVSATYVALLDLRKCFVWNDGIEPPPLASKATMLAITPNPECCFYLASAPRESNAVSLRSERSRLPSSPRLMMI